MSEPDVAGVDELLAQAAWVRALARRLARDVDAADDLAQETWVAALRHPPEGDRPIGPWLGRVLGNVARRARRERRRRAKREAAAARAERDDTSPDRLLAELEMQREIARLVAELAEPYRSVVLRRYYRGESAAAIARATGVPAGTVRSQLARGLELLRRRLVLRCDGDPRRASHALALIAGFPADLFARVLLKGAWTVQWTGKALWIAGGAAVLAFGVWSLQQLAPEPPLEAGLVEARGEAAELAAPALDAGGAPASEALAAGRQSAATAPTEPLADTAERASVLRLVAVDPAGRPLSGAVLQHAPQSATRATRESAPSGADGAIELELGDELLGSRPGGMRWALRFSVRCAGRATRFLRVTPFPERVTDLGEIVLADGGGVAGVVVDAAGAPVAGARVLATDVFVEGSLEQARLAGPSADAGVPETLSGADGGFQLGGVPAGAVRVWAHAGEMPWAISERVEVLPRRDTPGLRLVLAPLDELTRILGRVVGPEGDPVGGAIVEFAPASEPFQTDQVVADSHGDFAIVTRTTGPYGLVARDPRERWSPASFPAVQPGARDVELRLLPAARMVLTVVDPSGATPSKFHVGLGGDEPLGHDWRAFEGSAGPVTLTLPGYRFRLSVSSEGYEAAELGPWEPGAAPPELLCELERLPRVSGTVVAEGEPVAGARIEMRELLEGQRAMMMKGFLARVSAFGNHETTSAADGTFEVSARSDWGKLVLLASREGFATTEAGPFEIGPESGVEGLVVELARGGAIEGRVLVSAPEKPLGKLVAASRGDGKIRFARADAEGAYRLEHLTPGPWEVAYQPAEAPNSVSIVEAPEEYPWNCEVFEGESTRHDIDLRFESQPLLRGCLVLAGQPAVGWSAHLEPFQHSAALEATRAVLTGADGCFELRAPAGRYELVLASPPEREVVLVFAQPLEMRGERVSWAHESELGVVAGSGASPGAALVFAAPGSSFAFPAWPEGAAEVRFEATFRAAPDGSFRAAVPVGAGRIGTGSGPVWTAGWDWLADVEVRAGEPTRVDLD